MGSKSIQRSQRSSMDRRTDKQTTHTVNILRKIWLCQFSSIFQSNNLDLVWSFIFITKYLEKNLLPHGKNIPSFHSSEINMTQYNKRVGGHKGVVLVSQWFGLKYFGLKKIYTKLQIIVSLHVQSIYDKKNRWQPIIWQLFNMFIRDQLLPSVSHLSTIHMGKGLLINTLLMYSGQHQKVMWLSIVILIICWLCWVPCTIYGNIFMNRLGVGCRNMCWLTRMQHSFCKFPLEAAVKSIYPKKGGEIHTIMILYL